jgi:hypothetical protein
MGAHQRWEEVLTGWRVPMLNVGLDIATSVGKEFHSH